MKFPQIEMLDIERGKPNEEDRDKEVKCSDNKNTDIESNDHFKSSTDCAQIFQESK